MTVEVRATLLADKIIQNLPKGSRNAYDQSEADLARRGCAALACRLSGELLDHLCAVHLTGSMRVVVAFESATVAYVVLVGKHDSKRPPLDVYQQLYALTGHEPSDEAGRDKPPCCDTESGGPPIESALLDDLLTRMRRFQGIGPAHDPRTTAHHMARAASHNVSRAVRFRRDGVTRNFSAHSPDSAPSPHGWNSRARR